MDVIIPWLLVALASRPVCIIEIGADAVADAVQMLESLAEQKRGGEDHEACKKDPVLFIDRLGAVALQYPQASGHEAQNPDGHEGAEHADHVNNERFLGGVHACQADRAHSQPEGIAREIKPVSADDGGEAEEHQQHFHDVIAAEEHETRRDRQKDGRPANGHPPQSGPD